MTEGIGLSTKENWRKYETHLLAHRASVVRRDGGSAGGVEGNGLLHTVRKGETMTDVELLRDLAKSEDSVIAPNISMEGERIRSIAARYERMEKALREIADMPTEDGIPYAEIEDRRELAREALKNE